MGYDSNLTLEIARKLGGPSALGREVYSYADIAHVVATGTSTSSIASVMASGFVPKEIHPWVISERTLESRNKKHKPLTPDETDRLVRLARIQTIAERVFIDPKNGNLWLREPLGILGGRTPLEMAHTEAGARVVEQILAKIEWGAAA